MNWQRWIAAGALAASLLVVAHAQSKPKPPATPRIYVFENGAIKGLDVALFNFKREELKEVDFVDASYLIVHPRGTLMFDSGTVPDSQFKGDGKPVVEGVISATQPHRSTISSHGSTLARSASHAALLGLPVRRPAATRRAALARARRR